jgi:hypothetical protein
MPVRIAVQALGHKQHATGQGALEVLLERGAQHLGIDPSGVAPTGAENIDQTTHGDLAILLK